MTNRPHTDSPEQAEAVFYDAFENGDLDAMAEIWAQSDTIVCVHPHGPQLVGYGPVMKSWQNILSHSAGFRVSVEVVNHYDNGDMAVRFVNETLVNEHGNAAPVTVLATNAYRKTESGWRIVLHHASPMPPTEEEETADDDYSDVPETSVTLH